MAEENITQFLVKVLNTIAVILIWMMANVLIGIYLGYGFFEGNITWKNIVYYIIFLVSLFYIIKYIRRKWKL